MTSDEIGIAKELIEERLSGLGRVRGKYEISVLPRAIHINFTTLDLVILLKWFQSGENTHRKIIVQSSNSILPTLIKMKTRYSGPEEMVKNVMSFLMNLFIIDLYASK